MHMCSAESPCPMWLPVAASGAKPQPAEPTLAKGAAQHRGLALRCTGSGGQKCAACALACRVEQANEHEAAEHVAGWGSVVDAGRTIALLNSSVQLRAICF